MTYNFSQKFLFTAFFFYLSFNLFSQEFDQKKTDHQLSVISLELMMSGKFEETISLNKQLVDLCKKSGYLKGIAHGNYNIGRSLSLQGKHPESIQHLELAQKENDKLKDTELGAKIYAEYGKIYAELGLFSHAIDYLKKCVANAKKLSDPEKKMQLNDFAYGNLAYIHNVKNENDSSIYYRQLAYRHRKTIYNVLELAHIHMKSNESLDSAKYFLEEADLILVQQTYPTPYDKFIVEEDWGKYYTIKKNYDKALFHYKNALEMADILNNANFNRDVYKDLYQTYLKKQDTAMSNLYLLKYTEINDSLSVKEKESLDVPVKKFINDKEKEYKNKQQRLYFIIGVISFLTILLLYMLVSYRKKKKRLKEKIWETQQIISEKEQMIDQKTEETIQLKQKVNKSFEEVVLLAKENHPEFTTRFSEIYPEFYEKLKRIDPKLLKTEIKFCALLYLNFSTKDIAEYTFVTVKAVQHSKFRLRKKLNIPSDADIVDWISDYQ